MALSRRDYVAIAAALNAAKPVVNNAPAAYPTLMMQWRKDCENIANALERESATFDKVTFMAACQKY